MIVVGVVVIVVRVVVGIMVGGYDRSSDSSGGVVWWCGVVVSMVVNVSLISLFIISLSLFSSLSPTQPNINLGKYSATPLYLLS
jgi:hypothetical protein